MITIFIDEKGFPKGNSPLVLQYKTPPAYASVHSPKANKFKVLCVYQILMAEYYPARISNLFLGEGIPIPYFSVAVSFVYIGGSVALPHLVVGFLFWCCKNFVNYHVKRCPHCTKPEVNQGKMQEILRFDGL